MTATSAQRVRPAVLAMVTLALCVAGSAAALAQVASPAASVPASPPASPEMTNNPNGWPPVRFVGGDPLLLVFTSDCGIPGVDTFHLTSSTGGWFAELAVTLTDHDEVNHRYSGSEVGHVTAPNGEDGPVDTEAVLAYDASTGEWVLDGTWIEGVTIENCAPPASPSA